MGIVTSPPPENPQSKLSGFGQQTVIVHDPVAGRVNGDWGFKDVETTKLTHGIHPYPARMVPQIAERLLERYGKKGELVWDPYCGSGTVLLESMVRGLEAVGNDISPLATLIARAKTHVAPAEALTYWTDYLQPRLTGERANRARTAYKPDLDDFTLDVEYWFKPAAIRDLGFIRAQIEDAADAGAPERVVDLLKVVFSHTVRKASNQRPNEWKRYRRPETELDKFHPHAVDLFLNRWADVRKMAVALASQHSDKPAPMVVTTDCATFTPVKPPALILTSPPYGDSTTTVAYGQFVSLMMEWLGLHDVDWRDVDHKCLGGDPDNPRTQSKSETFAEVMEEVRRGDGKRAEAAAAFFGDMRYCLEHFLDTLAPGGHVCFVIGDRTVRGVTVPTSQIITEDAVDLGFEHVETLSRRIFFKVGPYRVNPIGRSGLEQDTPAIGREQMVILKKA